MAERGWGIHRALTCEDVVWPAGAMNLGREPGGLDSHVRGREVTAAKSRVSRVSVPLGDPGAVGWLQPSHRMIRVYLTPLSVAPADRPAFPKITAMTGFNEVVVSAERFSASRLSTNSTSEPAANPGEERNV